MTWLKDNKNWLRESVNRQQKPPADLLNEVEIVIPNEPFFKLSEVARICKVHINTVRRWIDEGLLKAITVGGHKRITYREFYSFLQKRT